MSSTIHTLHSVSDREQRDMKLLLSTRFSESCFYAIPAIAQWMDDICSALTIVHVYDARKTHRSDAQAQLNAFFAEADRYERTRRVLLQGDDPARAIAAFLEAEPHDLLVCPASDQVGLPRPFHRSTRAQLLRLTRTPLWTVGAAAQSRRATRPERVGCVISRRSDSRRPLELAAQYAQFHGACLQLIYLVPEVDDGMLRNPLLYNEPLSERVAAYELERIVEALAITSEIFTAQGVCSRSVEALVERARTDLLFIGKNEVLRRKLWVPDIAGFADMTGCPVVCVDHDRSLPLRALVPARDGAARGLTRAPASSISARAASERVARNGHRPTPPEPR